jgi:cytochrome d ubiquinol oxidase subunit I
MDQLFASRIQFGFTVAFHYLFPPLSMGLSVMLVALESAWVISRQPSRKTDVGLGSYL